MSTLAEIEHAVEALPRAEQEALLHFLAARFEPKPPVGATYQTKTHPGGVRSGIDSDKLDQLAEDF